jgi:cation diffusion facilitator family transporter
LQASKENINVQKLVSVVSVVLLVTKFIAWYLTRSVAVLTDAMESIVNVTAGFIGLYSLYVAAKPRDKDHPYGHGKAEFLSAAFEGTLIGMAGLVILYQSIQQLLHPVALTRIDTGIWLISITAIINFATGWYCIKTGKRNNSLALIASGKHLQSDTISTVGIIIGLILLYFTGLLWIDSVVAIIFGMVILYTGYAILRKSIAGIMDEADEQLLEKMVAILNEKRSDNWVDLHNFRVIKYGSILHIDCHVTLPWYYNLNEAHEEIDKLSAIVRQRFGDSVELFIHSDACLPFQCVLCQKKDCTARQQPFVQRIEWNLDNILINKKHRLPGRE